MSATPHHLLGERVERGPGSALDAAKRFGPAGVIAALRSAGLRGRGGAGFPTATKWEAIRGHACPTRFAVMNAAEGEPGTFKDRWLLRKNPIAALEGLLVGAWTVGAAAAFVAIKEAYRPEIAALRAALAELEGARATGGIPVTIVEGTDEYLFGEEKALLNVIDGFGPFPRGVDQPPYEWGLRPRLGSPNPALVNNVETFAHAATIVRHGADSFALIGERDTPGTVLVTLCGDVRKPGVYEVETSRGLQSVLEREGGGLRPGRRLKAILSGVSAGVLLPEQIDLPLTFGAFAARGSGLGSAGFIVVDDSVPIASVARAVTRFLFVESCDQCFACKAGLEVASDALDDLGHARGSTADALERAVFGARSAPQGNRCALPVGAAALVPSLVDAFRPELEAAARAPAALPPWTLPKIVDFDEHVPAFLYDERQARKQPDWSYAPPAPPVPAPREHRVRSPRTVHLRAELADALLARASRERIDLDRVVETAVRDWLEESHPPE